MKEKREVREKRGEGVVDKNVTMILQKVRKSTIRGARNSGPQKI